MTPSYFIIMYLLFLFFIFFGGYMCTNIWKGIIKNLLGYFFIFISSYIINTYSQTFETQCLILYVKFHISPNGSGECVVPQNPMFGCFYNILLKSYEESGTP